MEKTNLLTLVVTLTVGIILAGSLLMPVISDATKTEQTFTNVGLYYMEVEPEDSNEYNYVFDGTKWTLDGDALTTYSGYNVIVTDTLLIRGNGQVRGAQFTNMSTADLTVTNNAITGSYTVSSDPSTPIAVNWSFTKFYGETTGVADYFMSDPAHNTTYVTSTTVIEGFGVTDVGTSHPAIELHGSIEGGVTVSVGEGFEISDVEINYAPVDGYVDLYSWESVTFTLTKISTSESVNATYSVVVIPTEITAELSQHLDAGEIALINALPVIVIIGLVLAAVGAIFIRNRD